MRIADMNWMQVESYLRGDDRADSILAERVSIEAAEPLGVAVFPVLA